ncbi:MAG: hypothetical protein Q8P41_05725 [Pseudomonadota bacterium]|nr:hypothetical protein [Pseudomonadota bacterium]
MKSLLALAASRPVVAWYLGYAPFLLVNTALVAIQSGWGAAGVAAFINAALAAVPVAAVWATTALLARVGGRRSWGTERAIGVAIGLLVTAALGSAVFWGFREEGPRPGSILEEPEPALWMQVLGVGALVAALNLLPLAFGVGLEAAARRLTAPRRAS